MLPKILIFMVIPSLYHQTNGKPVEAEDIAASKDSSLIEAILFYSQIPSGTTGKYNLTRNLNCNEQMNTSLPGAVAIKRHLVLSLLPKSLPMGNECTVKEYCKDYAVIEEGVHHHCVTKTRWDKTLVTNGTTDPELFEITESMDGCNCQPVSETSISKFLKNQ